MYFGLHTTSKRQRDMLIERGECVEITISPTDFHGKKPNKPIVCEEGTKNYYEHSIDAFLETVKMLEDGYNGPAEETPYFKQWSYKGHEIVVRLRNLPSLLNSIKESGIKEPVRCEMTGERLDGSFRTKLALYLGIEKVSAKLYKFKWEDIDEDFIRTKLHTRWLSSGKDYYEFEYGYKDLKNVEAGGAVYKENAEDRWKLIKPLLVGKTVYDVGCNEGYLSLQCGLMGKKVVGVDTDWWHIANLNRLIYEWIHKKDLDVTFVEGNVMDQNYTGDTVLLMNVLYHLPEQVKFLSQFKGKHVIIQCNLRKEHERHNYPGSHPEDAKKIIRQAGMELVEEIKWRDKPILIAK
jgi:2-polyprenyl-3-methyl-5-hydroxy-6-metoxy-1,4-benzoquinol methylase